MAPAEPFDQTLATADETYEYQSFGDLRLDDESLIPDTYDDTSREMDSYEEPSFVPDASGAIDSGEPTPDRSIPAPAEMERPMIVPAVPVEPGRPMTEKGETKCHVEQPMTEAAPETKALGAEKPLEAARLDSLLGAKGVYRPEMNAYRATWMRDDLGVKILDRQLPVGEELGSWVAVRNTTEGTVLMSGILVREENLNPAISAALDNHLDVTSVESRYLWENPRLLFLHLEGRGDPELLATAARKVFDVSKRTDFEKPRIDFDVAKLAIDRGRLDGILGVKGEVKDESLHYAFTRPGPGGEEMAGCPVTPNRAGFIGSDHRALVRGDLALTGLELQPVLRSLRHAKFDITGIQPHMTPRLTKVHFIGIGRAEDLARGLRSALEARTTAPQVAALYLYERTFSELLPGTAPVDRAADPDRGLVIEKSGQARCSDPGSGSSIW